VKHSRQLACVILCATALGAAEPATYRFHRTIDVLPGWCELEVPDDVFEAARPGLADVRISVAPGGEIPYAKSGVLPPSTLKIPLVDVERTPKVETTALADRGAAPGWADAIEIDVPDPEFIKPTTIEASLDRVTWAQIARGSIFATASGTRMTRLSFAPNDRRYWRLRFDDRNGAPIRATHVAVGQSGEKHDRRPLPMTLKEEADADLSVSTYAIALPHANLPVVEVRVRAEDAAFVRRARVFERVWFRDEVSRRLLGEGEIARTADGRERTSIALSEPTSKSLELDIERSTGLSLHGVTAEVVVESRLLRFYVPKGAVPELIYGSQAVRPPLYDITAALQQGRPSTFNRAKLGPVIDEGTSDPPVPEVARGGLIERAAWKTEQPIVLPPRGPIAYLDVETGSDALRDVRIVDRATRQVPYIVEAEPRHQRVALTFRSERAGDETVLYLASVERAQTIDALELDASSPEYFSREVSVLEQIADHRGKTAPRPLGAARWVRAAGERPGPLRVAISRPSGGELAVHIVDANNAPLVVSNIAADVTLRRLNFVFAREDELRLLSGSDSALQPTYDLALIAERVLSSPAEPATLGPAHPVTAPPKSTPPWFWVFVFAAALILLLTLARTLKPAR
jgi:hypothetical protein